MKIRWFVCSNELNGKINRTILNIFKRLITHILTFFHVPKSDKPKRQKPKPTFRCWYLMPIRRLPIFLKLFFNQFFIDLQILLPFARFYRNSRKCIEKIRNETANATKKLKKIFVVCEIKLRVYWFLLHLCFLLWGGNMLSISFSLELVSFYFILFFGYILNY